MIRVTVQDLQDKSPRCVKGCPRYHVTACQNNCKLRFRYVFACPYCNRISAFYGLNNPLRCGGCKKEIPDMSAIAADNHCVTRKAYHLL